MEHFFPPNSGEDQKKKVFTKDRTLFFPRIQVDTYAQMHTRVKLLVEMQMQTILKLLGGYSQIIGGDIHPPSPPGLSTPAGWHKTIILHYGFAGSISSTNFCCSLPRDESCAISNYNSFCNDINWNNVAALLFWMALCMNCKNRTFNKPNNFK